jgi:serine/threonine-protein kinase
MGDGREPRDANGTNGGEPDETAVERGARAARAGAPGKNAAPLNRATSATRAPAFEETFSAEEDSDIGEPATSVWDSAAIDVALGEMVTSAGPSEEEEPTRALYSEPPTARPAPSPGEIDPHAWYLGRSFGGFRIVRAIAAGGMATVFLARKEGPARVSKHAAIKVVHPHLASEREFVHMFLDEARIAALIDHPNVCRVLDFGMAEGTYYLAMEYLLGETWSTVRNALAEHPEGARMLPPVTAYVLAQACEGLGAAHNALDDSGRPLGIVHRDVSPQNIFVAYDGTVRVLDFGIARAADRITSTRDGVLKGRLAYMSPEQMSIAEVGPSADIWSIGVVLREALEGKRLFRRGSDAETMLAVTQEPLPPWSEAVPAALRATCERALQRDPQQRHASAQALASELLQFAQNARSRVGSSELSVWMGLLFASQMEQKRALLQLPTPPAREDGAPLLPPVLENGEPSAGSLADPAPITVPGRVEKRRSSLRPPWLNPPALVALGSLGAIVGVLLGRVLHRDPLREPFTRPLAGASRSVIEPPVRGADERKPDEDAKPMLDQLAAPAQKPIVSQLESGTPKPTVTTLEPVHTAERPPAGSASANPPLARGPERVEVPLARGTARSGQTAQGTPVPRTSAGSKPAPQSGQPAATGTLLVAFEGGWAEVSLGGRRLGTTPGRFVVPAGKQTLSVRPFGTGKPFAKQVELAPDQVLKVFLSPPKP